jgi:hypothetical protein
MLFKTMLKKIFILSILTLPAAVFAATAIGSDAELNTLIRSFADGVVRSTGYLMFTLGIITFFWGLVQFIWSIRSGTEGEGLQKGKQFMVWGLIALFVMFSVWGIITFAQQVFEIENKTTIIVPKLRMNIQGVAK